MAPAGGEAQASRRPPAPVTPAGGEAQASQRPPAPVAPAGGEGQASQRSSVSPAQPSAKSESPGLEVSGALANLSDAELQTVLHDIDDLEATPTSEPDAVVPPVRVAGDQEL